MKLAINYSPAAAQLVQSGRIDIDYFKTTDWEWMVAEAGKLRPVTVHFNLEAGNKNLGGVDWQAIEDLAQATNTPYINLHLDARGEFFPGMEVNTTSPLDQEQIFKSLLEDIRPVVDRYGAERVIVENCYFRNEAGKTLRPSVEPELIRDLTEELGCGLLLDISHAAIAAQYLGRRFEDYFGMLPTWRIKEMHCAGIQLIDGLPTDHLSIQEDDWRRLDWVLQKMHGGECSRPWLLVFEYGGVGEIFQWRSQPEVIAEQVPQLHEHLKLLNT